MTRCVFERTNVPGVHRCRRCGFRTAPTRFPPEKVRKHCEVRGLGDVLAWLITTLSFGRLSLRRNCGCRERRDGLNRIFSWRLRRKRK